MRSILIINVPEDFDYRKCSIGGDGNIYYEREGEQRTSIIGNIKNLKPLPNPITEYEVKVSFDYDSDYALGWNNCLKEIAGKEEECTH